MRLALLLAALAVAAVAILAWPQPAQDPGEPPTSPVAMALAADVRGTWAMGRIDCSTCHYSFAPGFDVAAMRTDLGNRAAYEVNLTPASGYELAALWAAPRAAGDGLADPLSQEVAVELPPGGSVAVPFELPWPAAALVAEAFSTDPVARPPVRFELRGPVGEVVGLGGPPVQRAVALAGDGPLEGAWEAVLTAADPRDAGKPFNVTFHAIPVGYDVRTDDGAATGTRGRAHAFRWELPAPGSPGAPERIHLGALAFNVHPTDKWKLPVAGDRGFYDGNVSATQAWQGPAPFTAEELEAPWAGGDAHLVFEMAFDGLRLRYLNERGERTDRDVRLDLGVDPACPDCYLEVPHIPPFGALPPGTTHVVTELTWQKRDPLSPEPRWLLATSQRPEPDFRYPEPTEAGPGRMVHVLPVGPHEWERGGESWFQAAPLLAPDEGGRTVFDGRFAFRVEARRGPLP